MPKRFLFLFVIFLLFPFFASASASFSRSSPASDSRFSDYTLSAAVHTWFVVFEPGASRPSIGAAQGADAWCSGWVGIDDYPTGTDWLGSSGAFALSSTNTHTACDWSLLGTWTVMHIDGSAHYDTSDDFSRSANDSSGGSALVVPGFSTTTAFQTTEICYASGASSTSCQSTTTQISGVRFEDFVFSLFFGVVLFLLGFWLPVFYFKPRHVS